MKNQETAKTHQNLKYQYYNDIADVFEDYLKTGYRRAAKELFVAAVGNVEAKQVLEVSCGTGPIARELKQAYPSAKIVGTDISSEMIAKAQEIESAEPLGIQYLVGDAITQGVVNSGNYDVVVAHRPCRAGVSIFQAPTSGRNPMDTQEGEQCRVNVKLPDGQTETSWHYHWEEQTCLQVVESVGFSQAKLEPFTLELVSPSQKFDSGYTSFVDFPFSTILRASKL